jgi:hypothetical protein
MKILILTLAGNTNKKIHIVIDKIATYLSDGEGSVINVLGDGLHYVKESAEFITQQLVSASINSYTVYNSEENK